MRACIFQPGNFTCWGNGGVNCGATANKSIGRVFFFFFFFFLGLLLFWYNLLTDYVVILIIVRSVSVTSVKRLQIKTKNLIMSTMTCLSQSDRNQFYRDRAHVRSLKMNSDAPNRLFVKGVTLALSLMLCVSDPLCL